MWFDLHMGNERTKHRITTIGREANRVIERVRMKMRAADASRDKDRPQLACNERRGGDPVHCSREEGEGEDQARAPPWRCLLNRLRSITRR